MRLRKPSQRCSPSSSVCSISHASCRQVFSFVCKYDTSWLLLLTSLFAARPNCQRDQWHQWTQAKRLQPCSKWPVRAINSDSLQKQPKLLVEGSHVDSMLSCRGISHDFTQGQIIAKKMKDIHDSNGIEASHGGLINPRDLSERSVESGFTKGGQFHLGNGTLVRMIALLYRFA